MVIDRIAPLIVAAASFVVPADALKEPLARREFSANPAEFQRIAIAPIPVMHYGYNRMVVYTNEEVRVVMSKLNDTICSNLTDGLMEVLTGKGYTITAPPSTLVTKSDWRLVDENVGPAFESAHKEFGEVSRILHDRARHGGGGAFDFQLGKSVSDLGKSGASAVLFVDEKSMLLPSALRDRKTRMTTWSAYTETIEFNIGLVETKSGTLLWWHTGKFTVDNGREADQVRDCIRMLLWKLPVAKEPGKK
jgi:hypothetical protein